MINKIKKIVKHNVAKNSIALFSVQFASMIAPLIVLPYLSRVLGVDGFGMVMLALSACAISLIITDFGFNLSGTYEISKKRNDIDYVSELIGAIFFIKISLVSILFIGVLFYCYIGFSIGSNILIIYIGLNVLVQAFLPTWFFQGIEKMKNITIYMIIAKMLYVVLIFFFIKEKEDVELVILFYALSNFVAVLIAIRCIYLCGYSIKKPKKISIRDVFKDSYQFFLSRAAVSIYTSASTFLVGTFAGVQQAAMYGASEKLFQASQSLTAPIAQALFPYMAKKHDSRLLMKVVVFIGVPLAIGCTIVGFWANDIMKLIFGDDFRASGSLLQLFLVVTVVNFVSVSYGYPAFAGIGKVKIANYTVMLGALVQSICLLILYITNSFSGLSVVSSVLITEIIVMLSRFFLYRHFKHIYDSNGFE